MIHKITVENFFSIAEKQEMDFRVPANAPDLGCFRDSQAIPGQRLPLVAGIYGPNASGKSTCLRAVIAAVVFALESFRLEPNSSILLCNPFAHKDWMHLPTKIIVEFDGWLNEGTPPMLFRYELRIGNELKRFAGEVLYEALFYSPEGKMRRIFERTRQEFSFGREFDMKPDDARVKAIRPNASVISTLAQFNHKPSSDFASWLRGFQTNIVGFDKANGILSNDILSFYSRRPEYLQNLNLELSRLDLGLEEMKIYTGSTGPIAMFRHSGLDREIAFIQESAGTRKFIEVFPYLQFALKEGALTVIDELDTDIHPLLVPEILRWFYDRERNPKGAQLLFTAHNPAILDDLQKEQVFFTEKPSGKATRVYGASEIKGLRRGPSLSKKYLSGELGAVPHIG